MSVSMQAVIELHSEGCTDSEIADILGINPGSVRTRREILGLERNKTYRRFKKVYTVMNRDTEEVICRGEAKYCAEKLGMKENSFRHVFSDSPWIIQAVQNCGREADALRGKEKWNTFCLYLTAKTPWPVWVPLSSLAGR